MDSLPSQEIAEYLRCFFTALEKLKRWAGGPSHAISFLDERLCVLVNVGDFRERVYVDALHEDPSIAAGEVFHIWQTKLHKDEDIE